MATAEVYFTVSFAPTVHGSTDSSEAAYGRLRTACATIVTWQPQGLGISNGATYNTTAGGVQLPQIFGLDRCELNPLAKSPLTYTEVGNQHAQAPGQTVLLARRLVVAWCTVRNSQIAK